MKTCTITRGRETARKSEWANPCHSILVPSLTQFLPILLWRRVYYCKGSWNRADVLLSKPLSQYSGPKISSDSPFIVVKMCVLLQGDVKPRWRLFDKSLSKYSGPVITSVPADTEKIWVLLRGEVKPRRSLIEQTYFTVFWSHRYLSSCIYCCEIVYTIAKGRETARISDWAKSFRCNMVP